MSQFPKSPSPISRREALLSGVAGALLVSSPALGATASLNSQRPLIIDGLGGIGNPNLRSSDDRPWADIDARAIADGHHSGLTAANVTMGYVAGPDEPFEASISDVSSWDRFIRDNPDDVRKIWSAVDIAACHESHKIGIIYGFQNAAMMGDNASRARIFADLGVRIIQLTYNIRNQLGDGALEAENLGLTEFGREVVAVLNENRVLVDLSHSGEKTCLDAIAVSTAPITISHTGCRALGDHPRNKTDDELRRVADKGGIVGIYHMPYMTPGRQSYFEDFVRHIEHALDVCGEDHVGIGTDTSVSTVDDMEIYKLELRKEVERRARLGVGAPGELSGIMPMLPDLRGPDQFRMLADELATRGHRADRIEKILGKNFLRQMTEVWGS